MSYPDSPALTELYARIPPVKGCRTNCADCCGPAPMIAVEERQINSIMRPSPHTVAGHFITPTHCGTCSYSTPRGCSIYATRPFMCRLFGASVEAERLRCPHGARPDKPLTAGQAAAITADYARLSRTGAMSGASGQ